MGAHLGSQAEAHNRVFLQEKHLEVPWRNTGFKGSILSPHLPSLRDSTATDKSPGQVSGIILSS